MEKKVRDFENMKGVSPIHLFRQVWGVGRLTTPKHSREWHRIIYSPEGKEYHLYGDDVKHISSQRADYYDSPIYSSTRIDAAKVKIYILTTILDERKNWCFDLEHLPKLKENIKVIYDNGTIKNINFSGQWDEVNITLVRNDRNKRIKPLCWKSNNV